MSHVRPEQTFTRKQAVSVCNTRDTVQESITAGGKSAE